MSNTILEALPFTSKNMSYTNTGTNDSNMTCECQQRLRSTPAEPILQQTHIANGDLTMDAAEKVPAWNTSRSASPLSSNIKKSDSATDTPYNSVASSESPSQRIAYAESTNGETEGLSAYDRDNMEQRRGSRASGLSAGSSATPSRSRSRGAWGEHRLSQDEKVWAQDKEKKHGKLFEKIFDHKLAPDFLK